jgi:hypothetical protein
MIATLNLKILELIQEGHIHGRAMVTMKFADKTVLIIPEHWLYHEMAQIFRRYNPEGILIQERIDGVEQLVIGKPSIARKISNAAGAISRVIKATRAGQQVRVSQAEQDRRLEVCKGCEFFTGITCLKCGCVIRFKMKLATEACPIGKW